MYGIGYDSSADDYKVVEIDIREPEYDYDSDDDDDESFCNRASVYSLKTDSWRRIQDVPDYRSSYSYRSSYEPPSSLVLVNGCLHWFSYRDSIYVIAAFDLADEKFPDVQIPSSLDNSKFDMQCCKLGVLGECLCLLVPQYSHTTDIWVMKEYGVIESWTKFTSVCGLDMYMTKFLCFVDGEVLFEVDGDNKFVAFNAKEKTRRDIVVCGIPTMFKAGQTYVESLVSPYHCEGKEKLKVYQLDRHSVLTTSPVPVVQQVSHLHFEGENCELLHYNGMGSVAATSEVVSLDPITLVNDAPLSSDCWEVWVNYVFEPEVPLYRTHPNKLFSSTC
ncbi:F-box/kelch-repeat protein At3g06240-like isoform X2 [Cornus florida]|uniref:F-box/kelch-repeat protein At3g06240-like isoform X2 n=1 Tax=Cornus florida TaxID=4283 RepID=UPI002897A351|nr:F-box/kelch-repeat protein At3g06240-like isoform X2 [Cornus florida]